MEARVRIAQVPRRCSHRAGRAAVVLAAVVLGSAALTAPAHALVDAKIVGNNVIVTGTALHDEIVVRLSGSDLRVSDKDRVNGHAGCRQAGGEAACALSGITGVTIDAGGSADSVQANGNVPVPVTVSGGKGADTLSVFAAVDGNEVHGGDDNDTIQGSQGDDTLSGDGGDDTIQGGAGADHLGGAEFSLGDPGADTMRGDAGDDTLKGGPGPDTLIGGTGIDTALYRDKNGATVTIGTASGNGDASDGPGDAVDATIEGLVGSAHDDALTGDDGPNTLDGNVGTDTLDGRGGNDVLKPGPGLDVVNGGEGIDTVSYANAASVVTITLLVGGASGTQADVAAGGARIDAVENAEGGNFGNVMVGNSGSNVLKGGSGIDLLFGNNSANADAGDTLDGGAGFDSVVYSSRSDGVIVDADGNADDGQRPSGGATASPEQDNVMPNVEQIVGGHGADVLTATATSDGNSSVVLQGLNIAVATRLKGGDGNDTLVGSSAGDHLVGEGGTDTLQGNGGNDVLDASGDGLADTVACGEGGLDFAVLDLVDVNPTGCEALVQAAVGEHPTVTIGPRAPLLHDRTLTVAMACPKVLQAPCAGRLELAIRPRAVLAARTYRISAGRRADVRLALSRAVARRVRSARRVRLVAREHDSQGRPKTTLTTRRVRIR